MKPRFQKGYKKRPLTEERASGKELPVMLSLFVGCRRDDLDLARSVAGERGNTDRRAGGDPIVAQRLIEVFRRHIRKAGMSGVTVLRVHENRHADEPCNRLYRSFSESIPKCNSIWRITTPLRYSSSWIEVLWTSV